LLEGFANRSGTSLRRLVGQAAAATRAARSVSGAEAVRATLERAEIAVMLTTIALRPHRWFSCLRLRRAELAPRETPVSESSRLEALATCAWIREKESLLIQGPPGVGKTHLAAGLAVRAIANGFSVAFHRLEDLLAALERDADGSPERLHQRKHRNAALLVVDELGLAPMTRDEARLFLGLISYRDGRGSMLVTSSKSIAGCPAVLAGDEVLATAIRDRLLHRSHVLDLSGTSYRLR
jgi:DNA replication protein DnaC